MATVNKKFVARHGLDNNGNSIDNLGVSGASLTRAGAHSLTLTTTGSTNVTLPTTGTLFVLPTLTSGSVLFSNGTTIAQDNANLFWDDTNNRLGIGTTSPRSALEVVESITGQSNGINSVSIFDNNNSARFNARKARGTPSSPTAVLDQDFLGSIQFSGYTGTQWIENTASVRGRVNGTVTSSSVPTDLIFYTGSVAQGSGRMRIDSTGKVFVGTDATAELYVTGPSFLTHTTEQLRVRYDLNNYCSVSVASNGETTFNSVNAGVDANGSFSFSDPVSVPDGAYGAGWDGSTVVPTRNAVYDRLEQMKTESFIIAASDEITSITAGTNKVKFRMPYAFTVTAVRASLSTAQTSGNIFTVDINESGTSILSTKLTIDNTETTSTTAATAPVISDTALADDSEISVDVDQIGDGTAKGLKITIIGFRP